MKWLAVALSLIAAPATAQTVTVTGGAIAGDRLPDGTFAFKAIPFAAPPVGDLRWAPPADPVPWTGVRAAHDSAPACMQANYGWNADLAKTSAEDCLYLEVRTPTLDPHARLPVLVFIHGGANRAGGATGTIMSGFPSKGVIIVSIAYRLGVFGFLSHPAQTAEQNGASGNYALMDQVKALQWVR
ncbi:MAG: carboxylesterase family protein, partial [Asticcacaulis sp.]